MASQGISRRTLLAAGVGAGAVAAVTAGGYGLVEAGTLPGKYQLARLLGACGSPPPPPRGPLPGRHQAQFWSAYRRRRVTMVTLIPAGVRSPRGLGVVVALHGLGGDATGTASTLARAMASTAIMRARAGGFAVPTADGGRSYWPCRADGDDPEGMIIHEALPRAAALGLRTDRIGIIGESMGGYGALLLAERLAASVAGPVAAGPVAAGPVAAGPVAAGPVAAAVAAISPAIFASYADARQADQRSFDGPSDFARNDVLARLAALRHVP